MATSVRKNFHCDFVGWNSYHGTCLVVAFTCQEIWQWKFCSNFQNWPFWSYSFKVCSHSEITTAIFL